MNFSFSPFLIESFKVDKHCIFHIIFLRSIMEKEPHGIPVESFVVNGIVV